MLDPIRMKELPGLFEDPGQAHVTAHEVARFAVQTMGDLRAARQRGDMPRICRLVQDLAGRAALLGALELQRACYQVEQVACHQVPAHMGSHLDHLERLVHRLRRDVEAAFGPPTAPSEPQVTAPHRASNDPPAPFDGHGTS